MQFINNGWNEKYVQNKWEIYVDKCKNNTDKAITVLKKKKTFDRECLPMKQR